MKLFLRECRKGNFGEHVVSVVVLPSRVKRLFFGCGPWLGVYVGLIEKRGKRVIWTLNGKKVSWRMALKLDYLLAQYIAISKGVL